MRAFFDRSEPHYVKGTSGFDGRLAGLSDEGIAALVEQILRALGK
jgi:hypothetical protein